MRLQLTKLFAHSIHSCRKTPSTAILAARARNMPTAGTPATHDPFNRRPSLAESPDAESPDPIPNIRSALPYLCEDRATVRRPWGGVSTCYATARVHLVEDGAAAADV